MKRLISVFLWSILLISCVSTPIIESGSYTEKIDGLNINFVVKGKGPIMIVGHPNSGKIGYELTLKPLEDKFTMVYYNSRGTGGSDAPASLKEYSPSYSVQEIELLRQKIGAKKIWLFGHSDQSGIALQYAVEYPKNVSGMILSGTSYVGTQDESIERRRQSENKRIAESQWFAKVVKDWDYMILHKTNQDDKGNDISNAPLKWWTYNEDSSQKVIPIVKEISKAGRRLPINNEFYQESVEERSKYLEFQRKFKGINTKILIINGKYDTNNPPKYAKELHTNLPKSTLVIIDKAGHFPWIEQKEVTFEEIDNWLSKE
ncbi:alpha/beta hydrolase [Riemerella anatipestifer]|uniref:alpha/beta fold hydrolase n=1 Tax=Riemerella anatipestifer TaxID=34085 RepID=UPI0030C44074